MPIDEVIRAIEQVDAENIQDVIMAVINRYRELYPNWRFLFLSANPEATDKGSLKILSLMDRADELYSNN